VKSSKQNSKTSNESKKNAKCKTVQLRGIKEIIQRPGVGIVFYGASDNKILNPVNWQGCFGEVVRGSKHQEALIYCDTF
jgi:hypothetical protein